MGWLGMVIRWMQMRRGLEWRGWLWRRGREEGIVWSKDSKLASLCNDMSGRGTEMNCGKRVDIWVKIHGCIGCTSYWV